MHSIRVTVSAQVGEQLVRPATRQDDVHAVRTALDRRTHLFHAEQPLADHVDRLVQHHKAVRAGGHVRRGPAQPVLHAPVDLDQIVQAAGEVLDAGLPHLDGAAQSFGRHRLPAAAPLGELHHEHLEPLPRRPQRRAERGRRLALAVAGEYEDSSSHNGQV